ncbi:DUF72 domain-containing protein [Egbenema bharatensis]|uniref:DUF72 domain-containing protein n=1 Tax=Egbenema bharatensis TaxID=3463334 RepID=UPI003A8909FE
MNFRLGCAVWAYKEWVGQFFPVGSQTRDFLRLYSRRLTTVEGNTTFYSVPDAETIHRWASETPDGFQFCLKLPRSITHAGLLAATLPETLAFLQHVAGLGDRLGPCFAQLPPSYSPAQIGDLMHFLQAYPTQEFPLALEVRHPDWFQEPYASQLTDRLAELGIGRVLLDTRPIYDCPDDPQLYSERRKPQVPLQPTITAPFTLIRYISHPDLAFNQPYLQEWVDRVQQWLLQGTQVYFFVHCPIERYSPLTARSFQQLLDQQGVPVPPLPWNAIEQPQQLSLF